MPEAPIPPYRRHLNAAGDLVTPYAAIRAGFVAQALEKNRRGSPFVQQARDLKAAAERAGNPHALLEMPDIQAGLLTAAAVSDKALKHLQAEDHRAAIRNLIENFLLPAGVDFVEELVYRFLLTRGDTLGGSMRNYTGAIAQHRLSAALLARFRNQGAPFLWRQENGTWARPPEDDAAVALLMRGISWMVENQPRTLVYNVTLSLVGRKNIDLCLLRLAPNALNPAAYRIPGNFVALGELKGGIDPAGADEHWKTAHSALNRINAGFAGTAIQSLFIGAAIVDDMANEIWGMLQAGTLHSAANLTNDDQLTSIVQWLTTI
jgi:hypothetical protein